MHNIYGNSKTLENKKIVEGFKKIKMTEFVEYVNKYISSGLVYGEKYELSGRNSIHYIINNNIEKGLHELYGKYGIDYAEIFNSINISTYDLKLYLNYCKVNVWERLGAYSFERKIRKNASFSNSSFTLMSKVEFSLVDNIGNVTDIENLTLYDLIVKVFEDKRKAIIGRLESENEEYKKNIQENKKSIKEYQEIDFENI